MGSIKCTPETLLSHHGTSIEGFKGAAFNWSPIMLGDTGVHFLDACDISRLRLCCSLVNGLEYLVLCFITIPFECVQTQKYTFDQCLIDRNLILLTISRLTWIQTAEV